MATPFSNGVVSDVSFSGSNNIDSLLIGTKWGGTTGTGFNLTYSFGGINSVYKDNYGAGEPLYFWELTDTQKDATQNALAAWSEIANLQFTEVTDSDSVAGDLRFANASIDGTAVGYYPDDIPEAGDVWFFDVEVGEDSTPGSFNYATRFLHEIGHALGLKHPHETDGSGVLADLDIDTTAFTVMSYRSYVGQPTDAGYQQDFYPTTPMLNDIAAIQHIYGANMNTRSGDTVYSWEPNQQLLETIWDGGGTDTIDWSNQSSDAKINLGAGEWSELGPEYFNGQELVSQTLAIAYDVTIENANGGSGNDAITGNDAANYLTGGDGHDYLTGLNGDDCLNGGSGDDVIAGGDGYDKLTGGKGADTFVFYSPWEGIDCITDFSGKGDKIEISAEGFGIGTNDYDKFTFDSHTGALYFDETQFALLSNLYCVSSDDIIIV